MEPDIISISFSEYEELLDDRFMLHRLLDNGVDNWDGYEDAMEEYYLGVDDYLDGKLRHFVDTSEVA